MVAMWRLSTNSGLHYPGRLNMRRRSSEPSSDGQRRPAYGSPLRQDRHLIVSPSLVEGEPALRARVRGCLLGGAVGGALGAPVEFLSLAEIRRRFGQDGIHEYAPAFGRTGAITGDTQMTMFTAEGLIRAWVRSRLKGICHPPSVVHHAYLRWLLTQGERLHTPDLTVGEDGWLFSLKTLHSRRAPGNTCLAALKAARSIGDPAIAENTSKGCGGVMRAAPVGLFAQGVDGDDGVFGLAADAAALTHGHPSGFLSAGYLAVVIAALLRRCELPDALDAADGQLRRRERHQEAAEAIAAAKALAARGHPTPEQLEGLGAGWVAEEALAIAICCSLTAKSFADGVMLAANHSGDSDSTAAITGNILGALLGDGAIPDRWLTGLELHDEIARLADDIRAAESGALDAEAAWERYPGW
jgi:ADP-ribosylglycohydrolase